jgi:CHAT domain-containing protein/tetratricopeptide (TPR) repeat protein
MTSVLARLDSTTRQASWLWRRSAIVAAAGLLALCTSVASAKQVTVKVSEAPIKVGDDIIGTAKRGAHFEVLDRQGDFYQIEFHTPQNQRRKGWLWREHVSVLDDEDDEPTAAASEAEASQSLAAILALHRHGRFREAIPLAERLVKSYEKNGGEATPAAADAYYVHARLYGDLREHDRALALYDRAVQASLGANGIRSYRTVACAVGLAEAAYGRGQIGLMRHCMRLADQQWNLIRQRTESDIIHSAIGNDQVLHDASGRATLLMQHDPPSDITMLHLHSQSIAMMRVAGRMPADDLDTMERLLTPEKHDNQQVEEAELLTDWALLLMRLGHFQQAETLASRGLELRKEQSDTRTPDVADSHHVLGQIKLAARDYSGCRRQCLAALDVVGGFKAGTVPSAVVLRTLMQAALGANDLDEAARCGCQALRVYEEKFGNDHADTVACRCDVAAIRFAQKKAAEAVRQYDVAARSHYQSASALWTFADDQLADQGPHGNGALACAVDQRGRTKVARLSAEWLINFKGLLTDRRARDFALNGQWARGFAQRSYTNHRDHPADATAMRDFAAHLQPLLLQECERTIVRRRIFVQRHGILRQATPELFSTLQQLDRKLRDTLAQSANLPAPAKQEDSWVGLDELQQCLPADTWLLECARYRIPTASAEEETWGYAVWVVPPSGRGDVEIVPLGGAEELDRLIAIARRTLRNAGNTTAKNEASEERTWQEIAAKLARQSLLPVWNRLPAECHRLLIAPDGALWDVPWGALPIAGDKYAIEQRAIDYLISERSLVHGSSPTTTASAAVVFADPEFDADVETIKKEAEQQGRASINHGAVSPGISDGLPKVPRLPGTRQEAEAIVPSLKQMTGDDSVLYTGGEANATFFSALKSPRVLVMSTHGFYLKSRYYSRTNTLPQTGSAAAAVFVKEPQDFSDPLDRCGLLLAGCNQRPSSEYDRLSKGDYGVLTGRAVSSTDLSATELVVLSACDTSLGHSAANGEVESLRQAFHIAGARQVVATLWPIPDEETVQLMQAFFQRLAKHESPAAALRAAQLAIIRQRRKEHGAAHPLYWAAFEMSLRQLETPPHAAE